MSRSAKYEKIYELVRKIPSGRVSTYGAIAGLTGKCTARMVGYAMSSLPENNNVPWHRVINSKGEISIRSAGHGGEIQRLLLEEEGVVFDHKGRVDLKTIIWPGPEELFIDELGML